MTFPNASDKLLAATDEWLTTTAEGGAEEESRKVLHTLLCKVLLKYTFTSSTMTRRIVALLFIFMCTTVAWSILGTTIFARTNDVSDHLARRVESNWGSAQTQRAPNAWYNREMVRKVTEAEQGKETVRDIQETTPVPLPLLKSRVQVGLDLAHRQKGLLWYATYKVAFAGTYVFRNEGGGDSVMVQLPFPAEQAVYDDVTFLVDGAPVATNNTAKGIVATIPVRPGATFTLTTGYHSQGLSTWTYNFGDNVAAVRDFMLQMHTNFKDIDFAENTLSPSSKRETPDGWNLEWRYVNLVSGYPVGIVMPEHLQPGPLAGRISFFAPVSLFFFFFLMFVITTVRNIELHPMNYFFLAAAFFAFHLLLAYLVDHVSIHVAFVIASVISIALVVSYLRLVIDVRFAMREAALAQLLFLVLFSYAFFFEGFTGLAITIGSVITLFVVMQMTGRVRWAEKFARPAPNATVSPHRA